MSNLSSSSIGQGEGGNGRAEMSKRKYVDKVKDEEVIEESEEEEGEDEDLDEEEELSPSFGGLLSGFAFASSSYSRAPIGALAIASRPTLPGNPPPTSRNPHPKKPSPVRMESRPPAEPSPPPTRPKKKHKKHTGYVPPSAYAHLPLLPDTLEENLICAFIGINPGLTTARTGHSFANPTNLFWPLMHSSGCTPDRRLPPQMDGRLPDLYSLGLANLVNRPTNGVAELSKEEMLAGVAVLEEKVQRYKPEAVCFVGKVAWEAVFKVRNRRGIRKGEFDWGWQEGVRFGGEVGEGRWRGCRVFVVPSTSGLVASYGPEFKRALWKRLGDWVQMRRGERGENAPRVLEWEENGEGVVVIY